jgi:hypothetical protein
MRRKNQTETVYDISGARTSLSDDQRDRQRKYMISMTLRVICFGAAIFTDGPFRWVMLAGSVILPWMAVVIANAGRENGRRSAQAATYQSGRELE